ncbi:MAG: hypothetical protein ABI772_12875 [Bacteroidota bacterium]
MNYKDCFVIGDSVSMRRDTSLTSVILFKVNYGEEFQCCKISDDWFAWTTGYENGYVSSKFVTDEENFVSLTENQQKKNGTTLYSLTKHYKKSGQLNKAHSLSLEIINAYKNKLFPVYGESCPLYGELAFYAIVNNNSGDINYNDENVFSYCNKLVEQSKDSLITVFALEVLVKRNLLDRNYKTAQQLIVETIRDFGDHMTLPVCYDAERKNSLIVEIKTLAFILAHLGNTSFKQEMISDICKIGDDKNVKPESKAIVDDLCKSIWWGCWQDQYK